jgi:hypothetical protein
MADCSQIFLNFDKSISLTATDTKYLRGARKAVMTKLRKYFNENTSCPKIDFIGQGSFTMGTIIKPLAGEFDIDIGIYLRGYSNWKSDWPSPETTSSWIIKALENHTTTAPINKRTCVRIVYKPIGTSKEVAYHVDLPIYIEYENLLDNRYTRIGITGDTQWDLKTDPAGLTKWFISKCKQNSNDRKQLVRLVKYVKAWKESRTGNKKFPSGVAFTVLMAENYCPHTRDDLSFLETIRKSYNNLNGIFGINSITKPVEHGNDLLERLSEEEKKNFMKEFEKMVDDGILAINENSIDASYKLWQSYFDFRFAS